MRRIACRIVVFAALGAVAPGLGAQPPAQTAVAPVPRDTFDSWMRRLSNAGRWGPRDSLGTLNLITAAKRKAAVRGVRDGVPVSLASDLVPGPDPNAFLPFRLRVAVRRFDSITVAAIDSITLLAHGYVYSHIDALSHFAFHDSLYNGLPRDGLAPEGARGLGVQVMRDGIVTRGVLIDIPRLRGVPYLEPGTAVLVSDLQEWERRYRTRVEPGDVVLIRTGRAPRLEARGPWRVGADASGPHPSVALWLRDRGVAALGSDVANEASPSAVPGVATPMHLLAIVAMCMPLLDNLSLEDVAREAAGRGRPTFLFVAAPLRIRGGTGSPVNPLAVF